MKPYFQSGDCTLYHGDCLEILPTLSGIDAVITDPPFGGGYASDPIVGKGKTRSNHENQDWDDEPAQAVLDLPKLSPICAIWGGNYYALPPSRGWLTWFKSDAPPSMASLELCWTNLDQNARQISWSIGATNAERVGHPTQKPYRVMAFTMEQTRIPAGALVCDPYAGSGTTAIACLRTGRRFVGCEIDERHAETAAKRIERELAQGVFAF